MPTKRRTSKKPKKRKKRTKGRKRKPRKAPERPEWEDPLATMDEFNQALFREKVKFPRIKVIELAEMFSADRKTVRKRMAQPVFKQVLNLALRDKAKGVLEGLKDAAPEALQVLIRGYKAKDEGVRVRAGKAVLDFVLGPKSKVGQDVTPDLPLSQEDIQTIAKEIIKDSRKRK